MTTDWDPDRALYGNSVAAELPGINPQMLRVYGSRGLLEPQRTEIERLRRRTSEQHQGERGSGRRPAPIGLQHH